MRIPFIFDDFHFCRSRVIGLDMTENRIFIRPSLRRDVLWYTNVRLSIRPFHMSRSNLRTPWPIHFKFHRVIGIDDLTVCILYGEITNFHSRVMGLYSSNCRRFFVCRAVNWEPLGQFTSNFEQLLELIVLRSVYFLVKFWFFIPELWDFSSNCSQFFVCHSVNWEPLRQFTSSFVLLLELIVFTDFSKAVGEI
jgi:hypothetical protein